MVSNAPQA
jgi:Ras-related GTP-binding protein A/B